MSFLFVAILLGFSFAVRSSIARETLRGLDRYFCTSISAGDSVQLKRALGSLISAGLFNSAMVANHSSGDIIFKLSNEGTGLAKAIGPTFALALDYTCEQNPSALWTVTVTQPVLSGLLLFPVITFAFLGLVPIVLLIRNTTRKLGEGLTRPLDELSSLIDRRSINVTARNLQFAEVEMVYDRYQHSMGRRDTEEKQRLIAERQVAATDTLKQVAHDIRSPLGAIRFAVEALPETEAETKRLIGVAVDRATEIAQSILQKNVSEKPSSPEEAVDLIPLLVSSLQLKRTENPSLRERIRYVGPTEASIFCVCNRIELTRLISNLLNNAIEALDDPKSSVEVFLQKRETDAELIIKDSGRGVEPEILVRLGEKGGTFGKAKGSGLGLFHARQNLNSWGGDLRIESKVGSGTTVTCCLRLSAPSSMINTPEAQDGVVIVHSDASTRIQAWLKQKQCGKVAFAFSTVSELNARIGDLPSRLELQFGGSESDSLKLELMRSLKGRFSRMVEL